jgi:hypothetical protein
MPGKIVSRQILVGKVYLQETFSFYEVFVIADYPDWRLHIMDKFQPG